MAQICHQISILLKKKKLPAWQKYAFFWITFLKLRQIKIVLKRSQSKPF